ncbi:MAG: hypothetical protein QNJ17_04295 [Desulfocapsaceae bacterium]|nr:hypothetical protein [Desulfocapsaceae bacterium]
MKKFCAMAQFLLLNKCKEELSLVQAYLILLLLHAATDNINHAGTGGTLCGGKNWQQQWD